MRIKILKPMATIYGGFRPGTVIDIPDRVGTIWCEAGIAEESDDEAQFVFKDTQVDKVKTKETRARPEVIPSGMFWCVHCQALHRADSKTGQRHLKYSG